MRDLIMECLSDFLRGVWHSMRGMFTWAYYDRKKAPPNTQASSDAHSQADVSASTEELSASSAPPGTAPTQQQINISTLVRLCVTSNCVTASLRLMSEVLILLCYRANPAEYWAYCSVLAFTINSLLLISAIFCTRLINVVLQNRMATEVYSQIVGKKKGRDFADAGSDLYASMEIMLIHNFLICLFGKLLCVFGAVGQLVTVIVSATYWAYYTFDYCWYFSGYALPDRLIHLEDNWPYYTGFGFLAASIDILLHPFYGTFLQSVLLPFYIISAIEASVSCNMRRRFSGPSIKIFSATVALSNFLHMKGFKFFFNVYSRLRGNNKDPCPASSPPSEVDEGRPSTARDESRSTTSRRSPTPDQYAAYNNWKKSSQQQRSPFMTIPPRRAALRRPDHQLREIRATGSQPNVNSPANRSQSRQLLSPRTTEDARLIAAPMASPSDQPYTSNDVYVARWINENPSTSSRRADSSGRGASILSKLSAPATPSVRSSFTSGTRPPTPVQARPVDDRDDDSNFDFVSMSNRRHRHRLV